MSDESRCVATTATNNLNLNKVFVGNVQGCDIYDEDIVHQVFLNYGFEVVDVTIVYNRHSGYDIFEAMSCGLGFVTLEKAFDMNIAISTFDALELGLGLKLRVKMARDNPPPKF